MLHWLSVGEFEYITDFECLKPIGNTASKRSRPLVEPYKAS